MYALYLLESSYQSTAGGTNVELRAMSSYAITGQLGAFVDPQLPGDLTVSRANLIKSGGWQVSLECLSGPAGTGRHIPGSIRNPR
jgi:hypothetical protein